MHKYHGEELFKSVEMVAEAFGQKRCTSRVASKFSHPPGHSSGPHSCVAPNQTRKEKTL